MSSDETPAAWAARVLAEHGPPPPVVVDAIETARALTEEKQRARTA